MNKKLKTYTYILIGIALLTILQPYFNEFFKPTSILGQILKSLGNNFAMLYIIPEKGGVTNFYNTITADFEEISILQPFLKSGFSYFFGIDELT